MRVLRRQGRGLSGWLIAVLLVTQLLASAMACPRLVAAPGATTAVAVQVEAATDDVASTAWPACHEAGAPAPAGAVQPAADASGMPSDMPSDTPAISALCKAHCEGGTSSAPSPSTPSTPLDAPLLLALPGTRLGMSDAAVPGTAERTGVCTDGPSQRPPGAPPLYLALLVLRN